MTAYLTAGMFNQRISHIWKTTIQETIEGNEKRSALFTWPRIKLENDLVLGTGAKRRFIYTHLYRDIHNLWGVPIVSDEALLTSQASSGQNILAVDEADCGHFYDGRQCILISDSDWESYEVATISTVDSGVQITLNGNLSNTWPVGTKVYPLYECRIKPEQSRISNYYKYNTVNMIAEESFESDRTFSYSLPSVDVAVYPQYNSLNLFLNKPLKPITEKYRHPYELIGSIGLQTPFSTYGSTRGLFERTFACTSKKEIYDLFDFFDAKQGRLGIFYLPTWMEDIAISDGFSSTDQTLTTNELYLTSDEIVGRHVYIEFPDGTYACREITNRPSNTSIVIDSAIGKTVATADLPDVLCCFLYEARFNVDEIAFDYLSKTIAKTKLSFNIL